MKQIIVLLAVLYSVCVQANYSILYSQKAPASLTSALTYHDGVFWTSVNRSNSSVDILRFDPYTYQIEKFLSLNVRLIKGLHFLSDKKLVVLSLEAGATNRYHIIEIDTKTFKILSDRLLPKEWGAVTGLAIEDENYYWISSANPSQIKRIEANSFQVLTSVDIKEGTPHAITYTKNALWVSTNEMGKPNHISSRDPKTGEIKSHFLFHEGAGSISGIFMKENLWILSGGIARLMEVKPDRQLEKTRRQPLTWKKARSHIVDRFHDSSFNSFGLKDDGESYKSYSYSNQSFHLNKSVDLPSKIDWRNKDGINWMTSVKDQGQCGSCVAFGSVALIEAQYKISNNLPDLDLNLSEQSAFSCSRSKCGAGTGFSEVLDNAIKDGIPDELCMPYLSGNLGIDQACLPCQKQKDRSIKIDSYKTISDYGLGTVEEVKQALLNGPLLTRMHVFDDFFYYKSGIYKHEGGEGTYQGRHTVVLAGYDDETHSFLVKNSWGPYWGEHGYFRIDYDDVSSIGAVTLQITIDPLASAFSLNFPKGNIAPQMSRMFPLAVAGYDLNSQYDLQLFSSSQLLMEKVITTDQTGLFISDMPDGIYDIFLSQRPSNQIRTNRFIVQNKKPETKILLSVMKKFENKTTFLLECSDSLAVPSVIIEIDNGVEKKSEEKAWPCPQTKFNLYHTGMRHPFSGSAKITIGDFIIQSNSVEID